MNPASWRAALIGALVATLATLPGLGTGTLWDNSETTYGEVAREILITHDWIVMHLNLRPWFVQPPLYFWIGAAFAQLLGVSAFALRLPSALATIATAATVGYVTARLATPRAAMLAALILSTSLLQAVIGRLAIMDALLDFAVALALLAWFDALRTGRVRAWYAGWVAIACGTLAKGLVAPLVTLLVMVSWALWERAAGHRIAYPKLRHLLGGPAVFIVLVLPWAAALWHAAGPGAFGELVGHYTVGRYLGTIENQSGPFWYYVPVVILGCFPWFPFLVPGLLAAWRDARNDRDGSLARLTLVWAFVPLAFFSFASTKLPNYVGLEWPAFAIAMAVWFDRIVDRADRRAALAWTAVIPVTVGGLGFALFAFSHDNRLTPVLQEIDTDLIALGVIILTGTAACFALLLSRRTAWLGPFALGAASVLVLLIIAVFGEPLVEPFKPIPALAAVIQRERRPGDVVAIQRVAGGNALIFYTRPRIAHIANPGEAAPLPNDPERVICAARRAFVVTSRKRPLPDPSYGRRRREIAVSNKDVLFLYDGPPCGVKFSGVERAGQR